MKLRIEQLSPFLGAALAEIKKAVLEGRANGMDVDPPDFIDVNVELVHTGGLNKFTRESSQQPGDTETTVEALESTTTTTQTESRTNSGGTNSETLFFYESDT